MNTRTIILGALGLACLVGAANFGYNTYQNKSQLAMVVDSNPATQTEGVQRLIARGALFDALQGGAPPKTRLAAITTLASMAEGGKNVAAFKELLQMLKDPDTESAEKKTHPVREAARDAVAKVGTGYPEVLLDAAKDADGNIRDQSREALKKIGAPMKEPMAGRLGDKDLRGPLGDILSTIGPETIPLIAPYLKAPKLKDDDRDAKLSLIETMGKFHVAEAAAPILPFKDDPEPNVRRAVVTSLSNIGDPVGEPVLIAALQNRDTDASARAAAAGALGGIASPGAAEALYKALADADTFVAVAAAAGLRRAGDIAAPQIARGLSDPEPAVRALAAEASGGQRTATLAVRALRDVDPMVRARAAESLGDLLARSGAIQRTLRQLATGDAPAQKAAWTELLRLGADAELARPGAPAAARTHAVALLNAQAAEAKDDKAREPLRKQIAKITDTAAGARWQPLADGTSPAQFAPLLAALGDTDGAVAESASQALARIGQPAVPGLIARLGAADGSAFIDGHTKGLKGVAGDTVAYYAQRSLQTIGKPAVDALIAAAKPGNPAARWAAITLGNIGDARAVAALEGLTSSPDADTAYVAQTALAKVKPG